MELWTLQVAPAVNGAWRNIAEAPLLENGWYHLTVAVIGTSAYNLLSNLVRDLPLIDVSANR